MSYVDNNPYRSWGMVAAEAGTSERASFIRQTYLHLLGAVLGFIGLSAAMLNSGWSARLFDLMRGDGSSNMGMLVVLAAFIGVSWLANSWAQSATSAAIQYAGLALYVIAQAAIMAPMLYMAQEFGPPDVIATAGIVTAIIFGGLSALVFITRADFSFMRAGLAIAGFAAIGVIVCGLLFGFNLGTWFSGAMILFAGAYILYDTSNVLHHYRIGQHVAAALALFASVALLFWYVLRLLMSLSSRD